MSSRTVPDALTVIHQRKSVRHFTGDPVPAEALETLVRAGMAAPSAKNCQPWEFLTVTDRSLLHRLGDALPFAKMLHTAGAAIIVCGRPELAHNRMTEYAVIDPALAAQNILLAAEAIGFGAVWTAAYPYPDRMETVRSALGIPGHVLPICVIPVGQPTGEDQPKDKFKPERIHRERW